MRGCDCDDGRRFLWQSLRSLVSSYGLIDDCNWILLLEWFGSETVICPVSYWMLLSEWFCSEKALQSAQ